MNIQTSAKLQLSLTKKWKNMCRLVSHSAKINQKCYFHITLLVYLFSQIASSLCYIFYIFPNTPYKHPFNLETLITQASFHIKYL